MITVPIAIVIGVVILALGIFAAINQKHPLYMHIVAMGILVVLAAYLGFALLNGELVSEITTMSNETSVGYSWNVSANLTASNITTTYHNTVLMVPMLNPPFAGVLFLIATIGSIFFIYFIYQAWYDATHPDIDPYDVDEGVD